MNTSEKIGQAEAPSLIAALAKAKLAMKPPKKGRTAVVPTKAGGKYEYHYADRADVIESYSKALSENGLAIVHSIGRDDHGGLELRTSLVHHSGDRLESRVPLPATDSAQTLGSWLTYLERYQSCALLDIAAEDDDDGARAVTQKRERDEPVDPTTLPNFDLRLSIEEAAKELEQRGGGLWPEHVRKASAFVKEGKEISFSDPYKPSLSEKWLKGTLARLRDALAAAEPGAAEGADLFS